MNCKLMSNKIRHLTNDQCFHFVKTINKSHKVVDLQSCKVKNNQIKIPQNIIVCLLVPCIVIILIFTTQHFTNLHNNYIKNISIDLRILILFFQRTTIEILMNNNFPWIDHKKGKLHYIVMKPYLIFSCKEILCESLSGIVAHMLPRSLANLTHFDLTSIILLKPTHKMCQNMYNTIPRMCHSLPT